MLYCFSLADISLCIDPEQVAVCKPVCLGEGGKKKTVTSLNCSIEKDFVQLPRDIARKVFFK